MNEKMRFADRRIFAALLTTLLALAGACASTDDPVPNASANAAAARSMPRGGYSAEAGPNAVGSIPEGSFTDTARNRKVGISVDYPINGGPYPLIVWSHDFAGSSRDYVGLSSYWASFGYVVVKPAHVDAPASSTTPPGATEWTARAKDVTAVIDALPAILKSYPELEGKIDTNRIGVGGHGLGAFTAMITAGVTPFTGAEPLRLGDPRVKAVVAMSPQGPDEQYHLTTASYQGLAVPTLFLTGTRDTTATGKGVEWRRSAFELSPAGNKYFLAIEGAGPGAFGGRFSEIPRERTGDNEPFIDNRDPFGRNNPQQTPTPEERQRLRNAGTFQRERGVFALVKTSSLAFWDAQLRSEKGGREYLERLKGRSDVEFLAK